MSAAMHTDSPGTSSLRTGDAGAVAAYPSQEAAPARHPPFNPGPAMSYRTCDYSTKSGAKALAAEIAAAWARCGVEVEPEVVQVMDRAGDGGAYYGVRLPGFINGMPPR